METCNNKPRFYILWAYILFKKKKKQYTVDEKINYKSSVA